MKKLFTTLACALFACMAIAACGANAQAQTLPQEFKASNVNLFTTNDVRSIECLSGYVNVVYHGGSVSGPEYTDTSGAVCTAVKAQAGFADRFVRVGASNRYINVQVARRVFCNSSYTTITWAEGGSEDFFGDGCALHAAIAARSN